MRRPLWMVGLCAVALVTAAAGSGFRGVAPRNLDARLDEAVANGRLDRSHAALYRLYALKAPERLPVEYQDSALGPGPGGLQPPEGESRVQRCGTTRLRGIRAEIEGLPAALRAEAAALLDPARPGGGVQAAALGDKAVSHALPSWFDTENFSIQWGPALTDENGSTPARDEDGNGVPDVVERWGAYFEAVYGAEVEDRGYAPAALASNLVPVYLGNSDPSRSVENIGGSMYAFTQEDLPIPYIVVNNDLSFAPDNGEGLSGTLAGIRGAMKVTAAHEFFHVIQFAQPLPNAWIPVEDDWWLEVSATWMEDEVFDGVNDYYQYFRGAAGWATFAEAGLPVRSTDPDYVTRAYGGSIFAKYLSEHAGGAGFMRDVWNRIRLGQRALPALESTAQARGGGGLRELFLGFAAANATMDYREGGHYGVPPVRKHSLQADSAVDRIGSTTTPIPPPQYLGATYLLRPPLASQFGLSLAFGTTSPASADWGMALSVSRGTAYALALGASGSGGVPSVGVSGLGEQDAVYGIPCFLQPGVTASRYATVAGTGPAAAPLDSVPITTLRPAPAGFDLAWGTTSGAAGYVVRWGVGTFTRARTVFGEGVRTIEVRGLLPLTTYDVEAFPYGPSGDEGPRVQAAVAAGVEAPTQIPPITTFDFHQGTSNPGGGGGGGGGCFVRSLGGSGAGASLAVLSLLGVCFASRRRAT